MTHNQEKFYMGCKKLDKKIRCANKKVNDSQVKILAINARLNEIFKFITKLLLDQLYTIESLSQKSPILLNKDFNTAVDFPNSKTLIDELIRLQT